MADPLKALGKYGSEKPEEFQTVAIGDQGYTAAGSTLFYAGKYYTQIVSTSDDPKFAAFAAGSGQAGRRPPEARRPAARPRRSPPRHPARNGRVQTGRRRTGRPAEPVEAAPPRPSRRRDDSPATYFALLPAKDREGEPKYVAQDVFGYSFLSDVFMADYKDGDVTWQGFLRPYRDAKEAKAVFQKYIEGVKKDGAEVKTSEGRRGRRDGHQHQYRPGGRRLPQGEHRGREPTAAPAAAPAEAFARALAKSLPAQRPGDRELTILSNHGVWRTGSGLAWEGGRSSPMHGDGDRSVGVTHP